MKLQFDQNLPHQKSAWDAVVSLFEGQESCYAPFTMPQLNIPVQQGAESMMTMDYGNEADQGTANRLVLGEEELLDNLVRVQLKHGLKPAKTLDKDDLNYTVEMETGTGKTYVYLRSIYELNQAYGMTKFIIVVPSIAIKEGVKKAIEITKDHLSQIYKGVNAETFVYDSSNLEQVRNFAESSHIQIMVINIDAFRKSFTDPNKETKANIIHRMNDRLEGMRPIELIAKTNPVVIIDEPQSVDTTAKSAEAIKSLNPLFTLRYSATHRDKHLPIYKLDAVDAYNAKLVKQIAVLPVLPEDDNNNAFIKLLNVRNKNGVCEAQVEFDALTSKGTIKRDKKWLKQGADLYELTKGRDPYEGYIIKDISAVPGSEWIDFTSQEDILQLGQSIGGVDDLALKRLQIAKTIEKHLEREMVLNPKGIKVLSLFFIDKVANYRVYDEQNQPGLGVYGQMFEEEFLRLAKHPKYQSLFNQINLDVEVSKIHDGYFSADNKGIVKDTSGKTLADESAYDLIMKDKERLLDMKTPLRFIFSHSALREGWDNPNVFQICTLNETASTIKKRQEIGRGLRLAVDSTGNRVTDTGFSINTLTVIANESYNDFTATLQKEIEDEDGIKFGVVEDHAFANLVIQRDGNNVVYLGTEDSEKLWNHLKSEQLIDKNGKVQDSLKIALKHDTLTLPEAFAPYKMQIERILKKVAGGLDVKDASKTHLATPKKEVIMGDDFKALWERIKYKTVYQVNFDLTKLITDCVHEMKVNMVIAKPKFKTGLANVTMDHYEGVGVDQIQENTQTYNAHYQTLPDVLTYLQNKTQLTRKTLANILIESGKLKDLAKNPQKFVEKTLEIIQRKKMHALVDGIKYQKIGDQSFYAQELFIEEELKGYLEQNMMAVDKSVYSHIVYDSNTESAFATGLEQNGDVKLYTKLPSWFKIDTPLGSYNPDWAVLIEKDGTERLYFVVETKSSLLPEDLRQTENDKIKCGTAHFEALDNDVDFIKASSIDDLTDRIA
ncbi:DEAD/DEAH box helicase family protein [Hydrogenovibrio sp. 3SP14C1]|uniref:type III restriction-modification system endonuclease n=1 Tax=Hydrogenovibrio sp. 3SP14C1 TaxID=3038774 RepID=UPI0024175D04|nr:DEAD/DEAH box helicase family protein [Hydrogenovibrio sp. 3SP14C1]MDG4812026.1 DEAD/DEAH box helicase family protein [Hydrogenovibrio sp. 3SP14C1]